MFYYLSAAEHKRLGPSDTCSLLQGSFTFIKAGGICHRPTEEEPDSEADGWRSDVRQVALRRL